MRPHAARSELFGLDFDALTERETAASIVECLGEGRGGQIYTANLENLRVGKRERSVRQAMATAELLVADGAPLVWASRISGIALPERVAGSSLLFTLCEQAADAGVSVFFLGGNDGIATTAAAELARRYPTLSVAGTYFPPFGFERDQAELARMEAQLLTARPAIVFVALPFPKAVPIMVRLRELLPESWSMSVGISLSFVTGEVQRAPRWVQRIGFEWLHRLFQQPDLARRYLLQGPPTLATLLLGALRLRLRGPRQSVRPDAEGKCRAR